MANKSMQQLLTDFRKATDGVVALKASMPRMIGVEAVKVVKMNFRLQGYDDGNGVTPWKERAAVTNFAYDYNRTKSFRTATGRKSSAKNPYKGSVVSSKNPILEQTRNLYNALDYFVSGRNVTIGVDLQIVPYAQKMNEGGPGKWGGKANTNTPARPFMPKPNEPPNPKILSAVEKKLKFEQDKVMREFKK